MGEVQNIKILFRVDASALIGGGHVMRCLSLAKELRVRGAICFFVCIAYDGNLIDLIRNSGFTVYEIPLPDDGSPLYDSLSDRRSKQKDKWEADAKATLNMVPDEVDWLVIDHYDLDWRWEGVLRSQAKKILAIDDLADRVHDADLLLDQNEVENKDRRYDGLLAESCGRLLGPRYALLDPQYARLHEDAKAREGAVKKIIISFGRADTQELTLLALEALLALDVPEIEIDVVYGESDDRVQALIPNLSEHPKVVIYQNLPSLAQLFAAADLAIGGAGTTTWERCCLGLPAIVVTIAENQHLIARQLHRLGLIRWIGDKDGVTLSSLKAAISDVLSTGMSPESSRSCLNLVDGHGAARVAELMLLSHRSEFTARGALRDDEGLLLDWANDKLTRLNAFQGGPIDQETHSQWFSSKLNNFDNCRIFIIEAPGGSPVGQVRFERINDRWELHYSIDRGIRGRGCARCVVNAAINTFKKDFRSSVKLLARVKVINVASLAVLRSLSCSDGYICDDIIRFEWLI